jgi:hypothetical protein
MSQKTQRDQTKTKWYTCLHFIPLNKVERKVFGNVVGLIRKIIVQIHLKPPSPTVILANHLPIIKFVGMM